jgi:tRNA modification GTPase
LNNAQEALEGLRRRLQQRALSGRPFRVVLTGLPNAGKSSLFNALAAQSLALVSPQAGTTRDYLVQRLSLDGVDLELVDTAGQEQAAGTRQQASASDQEKSISHQAQAARRRQLEQADLLLVCLDASRPAGNSDLPSAAGMDVLPIWTKCDLVHDSFLPPHALRTSAVQGDGIGALRSLLAARARAAIRPSALAPSLSRCQHHIEACSAHVAQAIQLVQPGEFPELLALELRLALEQLGEMVGAVYTDDLLDRIFGQFCIGK